MRVITAFFSVENLPLNTGQRFSEMKEPIYRCREWLGTNEGKSRVAILEKLTCSRRPASKRPILTAFHFCVLIEKSKPPKPNQAP